MANQLRMDRVQAIRALHEAGWSMRKIGRHLGVHRTTVSAYLKRSAGEAKPTQVTAGSPAASPTQKSQCEPYRELIEEKVAAGLSAQRIYQDLAAEHGVEFGYQSVKRFASRLRRVRPLPFRRLECEPGQEAQVDFGAGAPIVGREGRRRRTHVLRVVLSHSRKGFSQAVDRQTTENFVRSLEEAFCHFGGVPRTLVIDNLRAAVNKADWFDPEINPKVQSFCQHYGVAILPTRPRMPRHKGKVERGIGYVQDNALKGRRFGSLEEQNDFLLHWETSVADTRIHGTIRKQVGRMFVEAEQESLLPLPGERFPYFHEAERTVHRDGHVSVEKAYYSVPPEYVGRTVWARWDSRLVRIFDSKMEQIALHTRCQAGKFSTHAAHVPDEKIHGIERGCAWWLNRASLVGVSTRHWAEGMLKVRGIEGVRVLQGLLSLADKHPYSALESACAIALSYGAYRLQTVRKLIGQDAAKQESLEFLDEHPIIRGLDGYDALIQNPLSMETRR